MACALVAAFLVVAAIFISATSEAAQGSSGAGWVPLDADPGESVRMPGCGPFTWQVRTDPARLVAPHGQIAAAFDEVARHTGFTFREADSGVDPDILIGWLDTHRFAAKYPEFWETAAGVAHRRSAMRDGYLVDFDGQHLNEQPHRQRRLLLHELGHVVGLDHVDDRGSVMVARGDTEVFSAGDIAGFEALSAGC